MIILLLIVIVIIAAAAALYFLKIKPEAEAKAVAKAVAEAEAEAVTEVFEAEAIGRTVRYEQAKGCINIHWIKVYGIEFQGGEEELISWQKPTIASSNYGPEYVAENIHVYEILGESIGLYHSQCDEKLQWIEIDLEKDYKITRIEVRNRGGDRMFVKKGKISILDMDKNEIWSDVIREIKNEYSYTI
jgi:hypothetical protein